MVCAQISLAYPFDIESEDVSFAKFEKFSTIISSSIFFSSTLFFPFGTPMARALDLLLFSHRSLRLCLSVCFQSVFSIVQIGEFLLYLQVHQFFLLLSPFSYRAHTVRFLLWFQFWNFHFVLLCIFYPFAETSNIHLFWECIRLPVGVTLICHLAVVFFHSRWDFPCCWYNE